MTTWNQPLPGEDALVIVAEEVAAPVPPKRYVVLSPALLGSTLDWRLELTPDPGAATKWATPQRDEADRMAFALGFNNPDYTYNVARVTPMTTYRERDPQTGEPA